MRPEQQGGPLVHRQLEGVAFLVAVQAGWRVGQVDALDKAVDKLLTVLEALSELLALQGLLIVGWYDDAVDV